MPSHPHLVGDTSLAFCTVTRIKNFHPLSPAFFSNHQQSPAFRLINKNCPDKSLWKRKSRKLPKDLSKCG